MQGFRIYVSSTTNDLENCRAAVVDQIRRLGHEPVSMEGYGASTLPPVRKCLEDVARCDLYVGLFAWRYGHVPQGEPFSITELEYREASRRGRPRLIFLLHEEAAWPIPLVDRGEAGVRMERFRKDLLSQEDNTLC